MILVFCMENQSNKVADEEMPALVCVLICPFPSPFFCKTPSPPPPLQKKKKKKKREREREKEKEAKINEKGAK